MNDRFRFRVWNEKERKFILDHNPPIGSDYFLALDTEGKLLKIGMGDLNEEKQCSWGNVEEYQGIVEQCTGLKDKNGKLIYEGDIVIWNDGGGECELKPKKGWVRIAEVKLFPDLHFKIIGCYPKRTCEIGHEFHFGNFIYTETEKHLKIIGNIHENPELLGKKK